MRDKFAEYHPVINFTFFIGAIIFGMILLHPYFLICSMILSVSYYLTIKGRQGWKLVLGLMPLFLVLSFMNPFFNTSGSHTLFTYWNRPYTLEAVAYGAALASMMITILVWFACYNAVMTSDKFLYLFGKMAPSITLILTMVLRLVPSYQKKVQQLNGARRCIGKGSDSGTKKENLEHGVTLLSALTSWALESSVITADSMQSRGYGCGKRTTFSLYRWEKRDKALFAVMLVQIVFLIFCLCHGAASVTYTPIFEIQSFQNFYVKTGVLVYMTFLAIPSAVNILEELRWHNLKSKI